MKVLPSHFYTMPKHAQTTMTRMDLQELLLETGGKIIACGKLYNIKPKKLGAGVYEVRLEKYS